jgi:hypothetical protein
VTAPKRKRCSHCGETKPLEEYPPCKSGSHGVYSYCRPCHAAYQLKRYPGREAIDERVAMRTGLRKLGMKRCSSCRAVLRLDEFYGDPRRADGKQSHCKECQAAARNESYLKREYGLDLDAYKQLMDAQDGRCAICGRAPKHNRFNVDHCHETHRIRALLCVNCNTNLLPFVERFPAWVRRAFEYLESPPAFAVIGEREVPVTNQARSGKQNGRRIGQARPTKKGKAA